MQSVLREKKHLVLFVAIVLVVLGMTWAYAAPYAAQAIRVQAVSITTVSATPAAMKVTTTTATNCTIRYTLSEQSKVSVNIKSGATVVRTLTNDATQTAGAKSVAWNGKNASNAYVAEGSYTYSIDATATAGGAPDSETGTITVDKTAPVISSVSVPAEITGSGSINMQYTLSETSTVTLVVKNSSKAVVRTVVNKLSRSGSVTDTWDGRDTKGTLVPEGAYTYEIDATDAAKWTATKKTGSIIVDRETSPAISAYSATPARIKVTTTTASNATIKYTLSEAAYVTVKITKDSTTHKTLVNNLIKAKGNQTITWNGKNTSNVSVAEGSYTYSIDATDTAGNVLTQRTGTIYVDRAAPTITSVSISANPIENTATVNFQYTVSEDTSVTVVIKNSSKALVKTLVNKQTRDGAETENWDQKDSKGVLVPEGSYTYEITATDPAGWIATKHTGSFTVDRDDTPTVTPVTAAPSYLKVNTTTATNCVIKYTLSETMQVTVKIKQGGTTYKTLVGNLTQAAGLKTTTWNGRNDSKVCVAAGSYTVTIDATDTASHVVTHNSTTITVDRTAPTVSGISFDINPLTDDSTVTIEYDLSEDSSVTANIYNSSNALVKNLASKVTVTGGNNKTIQWNGRDTKGNLVADGDYFVKFSATDRAGWISTTRMAVIEVNR